MPDIGIFIPEGGIPPAGRHPLSGIPGPGDGVPPNDRPGWIPPDILCDWDADPYAYQTEEEMMPAGAEHGKILAYMTEVLRTFAGKRGMVLLPDTFILYRDHRGKKQRTAPDIMLAAGGEGEIPSAYDLDREPPPLVAAEITSPDSRRDDMDGKVSLCESLGIRAYLVIDQVSSGGKLYRHLRLHLWRSIRGRLRKTEPDDEGWLGIPEIGLKIRARGRTPIFADIVTGEILRDIQQESERADREAALRRQEAERAEQETERADREAALRRQETERADREAALRRQETERAERLAARLRELGISPD